MNTLTTWLISIISTAFAVSLLEGLMPDPKVREVGKLVGGILILFALCEPLTRLEIGDFLIRSDAYYSAVEMRKEEYKSAQITQMILRIKEESQAYIIATAEKMGIAVSPKVEVCLDEEDIPYLNAVELDIPYHRELSEKITLELGVDAIQQRWKEGTQKS